MDGDFEEVMGRYDGTMTCRCIQGNIRGRTRSVERGSRVDIGGSRSRRGGVRAQGRATMGMGEEVGEVGVDGLGAKNKKFKKSVAIACLGGRGGCP